MRIKVTITNLDTGETVACYTPAGAFKAATDELRASLQQHDTAAAAPAEPKGGERRETDS